ncbi:MAG TPA: ATP-binding protein [Polyangiaceae bacterium]|nr:ATP-binding protein [Polyangiaceae bacterium]
MTTRAVEQRQQEEAAALELESSRVRRSFDLSLSYRELVDLATTLPAGAGADAVVRAFLDGLAAIAPHRAVGACVAVPGAGEPIVEYRLPPLVMPPGRAPTRLFPELADELVLELRGLRDSTLHVGAVSGAFDDDPAEATFWSRAADVLASGVSTSVAMRAARTPSTELTELRAQIIQSEKLATLGQLVAGVVHELANPVTSIVACTDFLLHKRTAPERPADEVEHLKRIGSAATRILKFSRDLVAYARPATEIPGPVSLSDVLRQAEGFCEHEFQQSDVSYSAELPQDCPRVLGQSGPLVQVFVNLFTNACHAMSERGGRLAVTVECADGAGALTVSITDTGVGIPAESIGKIFDPFFTTKEKGRGSGLGLSIVREILTAHSGTIEATSAVGEGTTFRLSLPLYPR